MNVAKQALCRIGTQFSSRPFENTVDTFFAFFGIWTASWNFLYFTNLSFFAATYVVIGLLFFSPFVVLLKPVNLQDDCCHSIPCEYGEKLVLLCCVILVAVLTLCLNRPDADDQTFLGMACSLLANPHERLQEIPGYQTGAYAYTSYDPLKAAFSYFTGIPLLYFYYLIIPAFVAGVGVIIYWGVLCELVGKGWFVGMIFLLVVLLAWGDAHRTHSNFGLVRMFQGKGVLVSVIVPAIYYYFFRYLRSSNNAYYLLLLSLVLVAGIGFSRGGVVIGPLLLGLLGLVSITITYRKKDYLPLILAILSALPLAVYIWKYTGGVTSGVETEQGIVETATNWETYQFIAGESARAYFVLALAALSAFAVDNGDLRVFYRRYIFLFFLILAFPWTSELLAKIVNPSLSWRWFWVIPFPLIAGVAMAGAYRLTQTSAGNTMALLMFFAVSAVFVLTSPRLVVSQENYTELRWPAFKMPGNSIYLIPLGETAQVQRGRLYLKGNENGY